MKQLKIIFIVQFIIFKVYANDTLCFRLNKNVLDFSDKQIISILSNSLSKDKSKILVTSQDLTAKVYDIDTGKEVFSVAAKQKIYQARFGKDNKYVAMVTDDKKIKIYDIKEKKELYTFNDFNFGVLGIGFSNDNKKIIVSFLNKKSVVYNLEDGKILYSLDNPEWISSQVFSEDSSKILLTLTNGLIRVYDAQSGTLLMKKQNGGYVQSASFTPDGNSIVFSSQKKTIFYDVSTGKEQTVLNHENSVGSNVLSQDGKYLVTYSKEFSFLNFNVGKEGEIRVYSKNGEELLTKIKVGNNLSLVNISADNSKIITFAQYSGEVKVYDRQSGELLLEFKKDENAKSSFLLDKNNQVLTLHDKKIEKNNIFCLDTLTQKCIDGCKEKEITSSKLSAIKPVSEKLFICSISQVNGFNPEKDIVELLRIINSKDYEKHEAELTLFLQSLFISNQLLYEDLVLKFPKLQELNFDRLSNNSLCKNVKIDKNQFKDYLENYLKSLKVVNHDSFNTLLPLRPLMESLNENDQESVRSIMTQKLTDSAVNDKRLEGMNFNKMKMLIYESTAPFFGNESEFFTDLSLVKDKSGSTAKLVFYSSYDHPIQNEELNDYGFYMKTANNFALDENGRPGTPIYKDKIKWVAGEQKFSADVDISYKKGGKDDFLVEHTAPDYDKLWKNGLNGLVVLGTNLKDSVHIMDYYLSYYKKEGFECGSKNELKLINDQKKFILAQIESGEIDYFIKEAHADGDEKNMFYLDQAGFYLTCVNKSKNESVKLIFPNAKESRSVPLSNSEFRDAMIKRDKFSNTQLIYFNTSCSSAVTKASHEVEAVANKNFINIPALDEVLTFSDRKNGGQKLLISAFRNRGTYQDMRNELKKNPEFEKKLNNHFIFPDEEDYRIYIKNKINIPLDTKIEIYDKKNKRYYMDRD
ncbi:MAG: hypothetical protein U0T83_07085 [Bacteriovoracaceae bacterium]